tara:strand:+ start:567 stop:902 length:336 start_codon:yes stop_codon:yes gene_type:complete
MTEPTVAQNADATRVRLVNNEGDVLFEEEAVYIDDLLSQAQEGIDVAGDKQAVRKWLPRFRDYLQDQFDCDLGDTDAYFVAREATSVMWTLKKKFDSMLTSSTSTESTPSN